ncbi:DUF6286 domain-containing protein [Arthrobacter sp. NPDC090010]|uniref:DUF6286 domain-containing protein n=1 Tax=Arthrobacter sp. NPDC090010 TaxID=3363942 RepID=UPI003807E7E7
MKRFWHVRPARTVALLLVALLLLAAGCLGLWAGAARLSTGSWPDPVQGWLEELGHASWGAETWTVAAVVLAVLALAMLLAAVLPGGRATLLLESDDRDAGAESVLASAGLAALVRSTAERADGVSSASVTAGEKTVRVVVRTPVREAGQIRSEVRRRAETVVNGLPLRRTPQVHVQVLRKGEN